MHQVYFHLIYLDLIFVFIFKCFYYCQYNVPNSLSYLAVNYFLLFQFFPFCYLSSYTLFSQSISVNRLQQATLTQQSLKLLVTFTLFLNNKRSLGINSINSPSNLYAIVVNLTRYYSVRLPTYLPFHCSSFRPVSLSFHPESFSFYLTNSYCYFLQ